MASTSSRSLAASARRNGLLLGLVGVLVAAALCLANPWLGFPDWAILLWPTAVAMMGLSGVSEPAASIWAAVIAASNGVWYFVLGAALTPPITLAWRLLSRSARGDGSHGR